MSKSTNKKYGFTIVELIVVMVIIGIFSLVSYPILKEYSKDAETTQIFATSQNIYTAAINYDVNHNLGNESNNDGIIYFTSENIQPSIDSSITMVNNPSEVNDIKKASVQVVRKGNSLPNSIYSTGRIVDYNGNTVENSDNNGSVSTKIADVDTYIVTMLDADGFRTHILY